MKNTPKVFAALVILAGATGAVQAQPVTYKIDPTHTKAIFETRHFGTSTNRGQWDKTEGEVVLDKAAKTGKVDITIDMASINTGVGGFNNHLKSADFFNVANYPTAKFVGTEFKFNGDKVIEIAGNLTLLGVTQPVMLKANHFNCYDHPTLKREICGGDFEAVVKRSLFGMNWGLANRAAADDIRVVIQAEAIKQ